MPIPIPDFWRLVIDSRLLSPDDCGKLGEEFGRVKGAARQGNSRTLAEWLISRNVLSRYQAAVILGGKAGPFFYGDYQVYDRITAGPIAGAFRAIHTGVGHPVTLRFLTGPHVTGENALAKMRRRLEPCFAATHPHALRVFDFVEDGSYRFLVQENVPGGSLRDHLAHRGGRAPWEQACRLVRQAALAIAEMHERGAIVGDLRPDTLLYDAGHGIKVVFDPTAPPPAINFRRLDLEGELTPRADYAAPELGESPRPPDRLTDIYALGCTLFELIAGRPPFAGGDTASKLYRHANEAITPLHEEHGVPEGVTQTVAYMMAKNPAVRYPRMEDAAMSLGSLIDLSQGGLQPGRAPPTLPRFEAALANRRAATKRRPTSDTATTDPAQSPQTSQADTKPLSPGAGGKEQPEANATKSKTPWAWTRNAKVRIAVGSAGLLALLALFAWGAFEIGGCAAQSAAPTAAPEDAR